GGFHPLGAMGASAMMDYCNQTDATHIMVAAGTATTLAGLLLNNSGNKQIIAVPVIKNMEDLESRIRRLTGMRQQANLAVWNQFHFGGYAKTNESLFQFMNETFA